MISTHIDQSRVRQLGCDAQVGAACCVVLSDKKLTQIVSSCSFSPQCP